MTLFSFAVEEHFGMRTRRDSERTLVSDLSISDFSVLTKVAPVSCGLDSRFWDARMLYTDTIESCQSSSPGLSHTMIMVPGLQEQLLGLDEFSFFYV